MKIKNDEIIIKNGKRTYELKNTILNNYLTRFVLRQMNTNYNTADKQTAINVCLLKFETPIQFDETSEITNNMFDLGTLYVPELASETNVNATQIISGVTAQIKYDFIFSPQQLYTDYNIGRDGYFLSDYYNKKVTAIGFSGSGENQDKVLAIIDVSNYNIYLQENEVLTVTRKDTVKSDSLFWSNDNEKVPGAFHLAPFGGEQVINQPTIYNSNRSAWHSFYDYAYGIIHSVGVSNRIDKIEKEYVIGTDIQMEQDGGNLLIKNIQNNSSVARTFLSRFLPFYPTRSDYKYYIIKYKVWQKVHSGTYNNVIETNTETKYFYHVAVPINGRTGNIDLKISYERG